MPRERILLIEDDPSIVAGLKLNLSLDGYEVITAENGRTGLRLAQEASPDAVLLDIMLPGVNGLEVLRQLRRRDAELPVLILTARGEEADRVMGLDLGADDYISKPFSLSELRARLNASLRRKRLRANDGDALAAFGDVKVDLKRHRVTRNGKDVPMTAREFGVLAYFIRHPERVITRRMLLDSVWKVEFLSQRTIDNFIVRLRAKLEPDPDRPHYFLTVRGVGYRFEPSGELSSESTEQCDG
jgi:DNA-binding response OmpR family regulator